MFFIAPIKRKVTIAGVNCTLVLLLIIFSLWGLVSCTQSGGGGGGNNSPVLSVEPADGAVSVELNASLVASFVSGVGGATVNDTSFILADSLGNTVTGTVMFDDIYTVATLTHSADLALYRQYNATLSSAITVDGSPITPYYWSFTTRDGVWGTLEEMMYAMVYGARWKR